MIRAAVAAAMLLVTSGCIHIQVNLGSNVVNVQKTQVSEGDAEMSGSKLEDVARDIAAEATVTP